MTSVSSRRTKSVSFESLSIDSTRGVILCNSQRRREEKTGEERPVEASKTHAAFHLFSLIFLCNGFGTFPLHHSLQSFQDSEVFVKQAESFSLSYRGQSYSSTIPSISLSMLSAWFAAYFCIHLHPFHQYHVPPSRLYGHSSLFLRPLFLRLLPITIISLSSCRVFQHYRGRTREACVEDTGPSDAHTVRFFLHFGNGMMKITVSSVHGIGYFWGAQFLPITAKDGTCEELRYANTDSAKYHGCQSEETVAYVFSSIVNDYDTGSE